MRITILGSGTSTGVPLPGCTCAVCNSTNPRNKRLRCSILIEIQPSHPGGDNSKPSDAVRRILVDTTPDLRYQALRASISSIDAVLYTHPHADHINGIDDLRGFNFISKCEIPVFADKATIKHLKRAFPYAFSHRADYEGGAPPRLCPNEIRPLEAFSPLGHKIMPIALLHGTSEILGYRIGNVAYLTDCSAIPEQSLPHLRNLDVLILDGLRTRPHRTHFTHAQAVSELEKLKPRLAYLTHVSHDIDHDVANQALAKMTTIPVQLAYDGLVIELH